MAEEKSQEADYGALVGLDWADRAHAFVVRWASTGERDCGRLEHTPDAVEAWLRQLMARLNGRRVAIAVEHMAPSCGCFQIRVRANLSDSSTSGRTVPPALYPLGRKSDPADSEMLLELLLHHRDRLHALQPEDEVTPA